MPSELPACTRLILSSASAGASLRKSYPSSCVSSPMAKYTSCWRAHGPQKAKPQISTSARRGQGFSVLLRTWRGVGFLASFKQQPAWITRPPLLGRCPR
jgi:hypothetical protein